MDVKYKPETAIIKWTCPYEVTRDKAGFTGQNFSPQKLGKWIKNGSITGFFKFIEKFGH